MLWPLKLRRRANNNHGIFFTGGKYRNHEAKRHSMSVTRQDDTRKSQRICVQSGSKRPKWFETSYVLALGELKVSTKWRAIVRPSRQNVYVHLTRPTPDSGPMRILLPRISSYPQKLRPGGTLYFGTTKSKDRNWDRVPDRGGFRSTLNPRVFAGKFPVR